MAFKDLIEFDDFDKPRTGLIEERSIIKSKEK